MSRLAVGCGRREEACTSATRSPCLRPWWSRRRDAKVDLAKSVASTDRAHEGGRDFLCLRTHTYWLVCILCSVSFCNLFPSTSFPRASVHVLGSGRQKFACVPKHWVLILQNVARLQLELRDRLESKNSQSSVRTSLGRAQCSATGPDSAVHIDRSGDAPSLAEEEDQRKERWNIWSRACFDRMWS